MNVVTWCERVYIPNLTKCGKANVLSQVSAEHLSSIASDMAKHIVLEKLNKNKKTKDAHRGKKVLVMQSSEYTKPKKIYIFLKSLLNCFISSHTK